ncbi:MAG: HTH domain-containing protein [Treponema phagedenis]|nr:HTH domain-containing protein [Treponema phagedenis]
MNKKEGKVQFWRLLKIDELIRGKKYPTAKSLAKEFEVSTRTIERDIEFLRDMYNAPISYDYSKRGYKYTSDSFF